MMKNYMKPLMLGLLLCCFTGYAYVKSEMTHPKDLEKSYGITSQKIVFELSPSKKTPVKKGEEVTFTVTFDNKKIKSITINNGIGKATEEQMKAEKYTFTVKPEKTTTYIARIEFFNGAPMNIKNKIVVIDENGNEIKENK